MMTQVGSKGGGDKRPDSERNLKIEQTGFPGSWVWSGGVKNDSKFFGVRQIEIWSFHPLKRGSL